MVFVVLIAFLKYDVNTQDLTMSIPIYTNTNQHRRRDYLVVFLDIKVNCIGHEVKLMIFELFFLPVFDLGVQLLCDFADR